ncbi:MAG: signal peptidase I [Gemmatimonadaceae bacterium]
MSDSAVSAKASAEGPAAHITAEQKADALERVNQRRFRPGAFLWEWARSLVFALFLFLFLHVFIMEAFKIPSGSMEGTLRVGDFLLVNKLLYGAELPLTRKRLPAVRAPERGDVIVFKWPPDPSKNFVKRLVGVPGDTLAMTNGVLVRNGVTVEERYVSHTEPESDPSGEEFRWQRDFLIKTAQASIAYRPSRNNWGPIVVPEHEYFVLGDNRDNSLDSRYWGFVPDSLVRGQPFMVYYSYEADSVARFDWLTRIRWSRLGERIH